MSSKTKRGSARRARARQSWRRRSDSGLFWVVVGGIVVVGVVVVVIVAAGGDDDAPSGAREIATEITVSGSPLPDLGDPVEDPAAGDEAPALAGVGFDGQVVTAPAPGKPSVVVFLAHWCPHCQAEVPRIVSLERRGDTRSVDVVAVATGTNAQAPNYPPSAWLEREDWPFPVLVDTADGQAASAYGLTGYPLLVFVDASGKVAARVSGEVAEEDLADMFAALAAGEPVPIPGSGPASGR